MPPASRNTIHLRARHGACPARAAVSRALRALGVAGAASMLASCGGCDLSLTKGSAALVEGLFHSLAVGGTKPDGLFVVAFREDAAGEREATVVSLGEEPRVCSLGPAIVFDTVRQGAAIGVDGELVYDRPGRVLVIEGEEGDTSGALRVFDTSCGEVLAGPEVELPVRQTWGIGDDMPGAYIALSVDGALLWVDPWEPSIRVLAEDVSSYEHVNGTLRLIEGGALVVRDHEGDMLASMGSAVTEAESSPDGEEVAFVDGGQLFVVKLADRTPVPIATEGAACKLKYLYLAGPTLSYREDCAAGSLALLDRETGDRRVLSSAVTEVHSPYSPDGRWLFFLREPAGGERELWALSPDGKAELVGLSPDPVLYKVQSGERHDFFVLLDSDGDTGTLGRWTHEGGFEPLLEGVGWPIAVNGYLTAVAEREGNAGDLVLLELDTFDTALRVEGVPWTTVRFARQAPVLGYIRDWDAALGAGTFEVWIEPSGEKVLVDEGVSAYAELLWPRPGALYAVRAPGREGLWAAYPDL